MAIRRGPMAVPESATDVFDVVTVASPSAPLTVSNNIDVTDIIKLVRYLNYTI